MTDVRRGDRAQRRGEHRLADASHLLLPVLGERGVERGNLLLRRDAGDLLHPEPVQRLGRVLREQADAPVHPLEPGVVPLVVLAATDVLVERAETEEDLLREQPVAFGLGRRLRLLGVADQVRDLRTVEGAAPVVRQGLRPHRGGEGLGELVRLEPRLQLFDRLLEILAATFLGLVRMLVAARDHRAEGVGHAALACGHRAEQGLDLCDIAFHRRRPDLVRPLAKRWRRRRRTRRGKRRGHDREGEEQSRKAASGSVRHASSRIGGGLQPLVAGSGVGSIGRRSVRSRVGSASLLRGTICIRADGSREGVGTVIDRTGSGVSRTSCGYRSATPLRPNEGPGSPLPAAGPRGNADPRPVHRRCRTPRHPPPS